MAARRARSARTARYPRGPAAWPALALGLAACGGGSGSAPHTSLDASTADVVSRDAASSDAAPAGDSRSAVADARTSVADSGARPDGAGGTGALPSGNQGIAARYPGDQGIGADPAVIFADDFERYTIASGLSASWNAMFGNVRIATEPGNFFAGARALEFTSPRQAAELSNGVARTMSQELDVLFLRYYSRFDANFDVVGSTHNGGGISAHYFQGNMATPGVPADGRNKFLVEYECWRGAAAEPNPGRLNVYIYHPEQRSMYGDHFFPTGIVLPNSSMPGDFGAEVVARPDVVPELGRWYGHEVMLQANTPGLRDGRIALWLDGALIADFRNLRLRDVATLKIDRFGLSLHIGSNPARETRKYYDNVVAARSYVGPMQK